MDRLPTAGEMYDALLRRDAAFEGIFVACVRSTGIFCRPTCTARKPQGENVEFAPSAQEALLRGYRPCRICNPIGPSDAAPRGLRVLLDTPGHPRNAALLVADWIDTPLGRMLAVATDDALALLEFLDRRALEAELTMLRRRLRAPVIPGKREVLTATVRQLREYFDGTRQRFDVPLLQRGSEFDRRVWRALTDIPYGRTTSYGELARKIGSRGAVRAVGASNGRNQLAIIVPCHRVIRSDGSLCGYGGGRWRKQWLLDHEHGHGQLDLSGPARAVEGETGTPGSTS